MIVKDLDMERLSRLFRWALNEITSVFVRQRQREI